MSKLFRVTKLIQQEPKKRLKFTSGDFPGGAVVKNLPANAGCVGPGISHMPWSN